MDQVADGVLLPTNVKPEKYWVKLTPDFNSFKFAGSVVVELNVLETCKKLKFHAEELELQKVVVENEGSTMTFGEGSVLPAPQIDTESHTVTLTFGDALLVKGSAKLSIEYTGTLNDNMVGFYRASYMRDGVKTWLATTQFEPVEARKALPCWDEPALKATFNVTLVAPKGMVALSNMPTVSETVGPDGSTTAVFAESPVMSTYLLAFIVGDLEHISAKNAEGVDVRVFTTPGRLEEGKFALDVGCRVLSFFSKYFGIDYPLPKCDMVAIPDFAAGAMENWGLITYRETALLVDEKNIAAAGRQRVAYVIAHELAHQWFGNLVTMQWWNDLWLNEGFATWVGHLGVDVCFPEWDEWTQFVSADMARALSTDALLGSHPIEVPIHHPNEIQQVFDALSYQKGACAIRQLEATLGADKFQKGLQDYLQRHKYANAVTADLWAALAEASGQPVAEMMHSWTQRMGFPVVTVSEGAEGEGLVLQQNRFLAAGAPAAEQDKELWWVPVRAISPEGEVPLVVLRERSAAFPALPAGAKWLKLNPGQTSIIRVNYTATQWRALQEAVSAGALPPVDRLGIATDAFALAKAGLLPTSQALELALAYNKEDQFPVWSQLAGDLGELELVLSSVPFHDQMAKLLATLFQPAAERLGWESKPGESHLLGMLRPLILSSLVKFGDEGAVAECQKLFARMVEDISHVHPDLRQLVMATAVRSGGAAEYDEVLKMFRAAPSQDLKVKCILALAQTRDPELVQRFLEWSSNEEEVKAQDVLYVYSGLSSNKFARGPAWEFVKKNWAAIYERFKKAHGLIQYISSLPLSGFATAEAADDAEAFYAANPNPEASMAIGRAIETIRSRAAWLERAAPDVGTWLAARG